MHSSHAGVLVLRDRGCWWGEAGKIGQWDEILTGLSRAGTGFRR